jgi:AP-2 complex subunit sigma-1
MNTQGKLRLSRWFVNYSDNEQQKLITEIHRLLVSRGSKYTNFIEV